MESELHTPPDLDMSDPRNVDTVYSVKVRLTMREFELLQFSQRELFKMNPDAGIPSYPDCFLILLTMFEQVANASS